jgi:hypothetical protein
MRRQQRRCAPELERAANGREPDRQTVELSLLPARCLLVTVVFQSDHGASDFQPSRRPYFFCAMRKQERGLTVGNLRELGFHSLHARCLNLRCRHHWQLSIDDQANGMKLTALGRRTICNRCGASARKSVRPGESSA